MSLLLDWTKLMKFSFLIPLTGGTLRRSRGVLRNSDTLNRENVRACSTLPSSTRAARKLYQLFFKSPHVERDESSIRRRSPSPTGSRRSSSHRPESNAIFASQMRVILPEQKSSLMETKTNNRAKSPPTSPIKSPSCVSLDRVHSSPSSQGLTDSSTCLIPKKVYTVTSVWILLLTILIPYHHSLTSVLTMSENTNLYLNLYLQFLFLPTYILVSFRGLWVVVFLKQW